MQDTSAAFTKMVSDVPLGNHQLVSTMATDLHSAIWLYFRKGGPCGMSHCMIAMVYNWQAKGSIEWVYGATSLQTSQIK